MLLEHLTVSLSPLYAWMLQFLKAVSSDFCLVLWILLKCHSLPLVWGGGAAGFRLFALEELPFLTLLKFLELGVIRSYFLSQIHR